MITIFFTLFETRGDGGIMIRVVRCMYQLETSNLKKQFLTRVYNTITITFNRNRTIRHGTIYIVELMLTT